MKDIVIAGVVALATAAAMEPWARVIHREAWHGRLWSLHRSHHEPRSGRFEANDSLSILHAPVAATLIVAGCQSLGVVAAILVGMGAGMTFFGLMYLLVHDGLIHERLAVRWLLRFRFLRRVRGAHLVHHRSGGPPYGLFLGPRELRQRRLAPSFEVFFDGDCPVCRREIDLLRSLDRRRAIRFTDIARPSFDPAAIGKTHAELMARIHGRDLATGALVDGVEVFRRLYAAVGFGPLVAITRARPIAWALEAAYAWFAAHRLRLTGRACTGMTCDR